MADAPGKAEGAFRTIGELSRDTGIPQHVLRYWETRFVQLRPLTRAGGRRYYRADDVALVKRIDHWLNREGYTVRGVQQLLGGAADEREAGGARGDLVATLRSIRDLLALALEQDRRPSGKSAPI